MSYAAAPRRSHINAFMSMCLRLLCTYIYLHTTYAHTNCITCMYVLLQVVYMSAQQTVAYNSQCCICMYVLTHTHYMHYMYKYIYVYYRFCNAVCACTSCHCVCFPAPQQPPYNSHCSMCKYLYTYAHTLPAFMCLLQVVFSGEEVFGKFFDLHSLYVRWVNMPQCTDKQLDYGAYLAGTVNT
jgi:hypothetical protein